MELLNNYIEGKCMDMCPIEEIRLREKEKLLHILEIIPGAEKNQKPKADRTRIVKSFCRSAAGKEMQDPKNLRPPPVLLKTIYYLLNEVACRKDVPWTVIYDFITDRLRSVRQDMVIQNASRVHYITILQPIVRFHAYAAYRLCEESLNNFDPFLNRTHLQECLKRLLCMYDDCNDMCEMEENTVLVEHRPEFEALYIILNLGSPDAITRGLNLTKKWRTNLVEIALELSLCYLNGNFIRVCRSIKTLPVFLAAIASLHLSDIRRNALKIMSVAYNSKNLSFPISTLRDLLLYDNNIQLISDCKYYGLDIAETGICFLKTSFNEKKAKVSSKKPQMIEQKLENIDLSTLLLCDK